MSKKLVRVSVLVDWLSCGNIAAALLVASCLGCGGQATGGGGGASPGGMASGGSGGATPGGASAGGTPTMGGSAGAGAPSGSLTWFASCGSPVCCEGPSCPPPIPLELPFCAAGETEGATCANANQSCDASLPCGARLVCAESDPKTGPGGCPISLARFKEGVQYLTGDERAALARELLAFPLASFRYKDQRSGTDQLGFLIEDVAPSPSVDVSGGRVNLYGYTSMVVATLQEQAAAITALRAELDGLRAERCEPR